MITITERKKIRKYFKKFPKWTIWLIILSLFLLPIYGLGLIGLIICISSIVIWSGKISDNEFDHFREKSLKGLEKVAMEKLRLDEVDLVRDNESIISPVYWNIGGAELGFRKGKDNFIRYTPVGISMIFFTEHKICIYQCSLDLITGNPLNVGSSKYFYEDIVSIETQSHSRSIKENNMRKDALKYLPNLKNYIVNGVLQVNESEQFVLTTKGGNSIKIQLPDYTILNYGLEGKLNDSRSDEAIASVEAMLDSKKA